MIKKYFDFRWKKWKVGRWKWLLPYLFDAPPNLLWEKESHLSGDQQAEAQCEVRFKFWSPVKSALVWNLALHNTSTFLLEGKDWALGQDMLALCRYLCLCQHYQRASPPCSHPHCTVQVSWFLPLTWSLFSQSSISTWPECSFSKA